MFEFLVVADDLSGACDSAVQCRKFGYRTLVLNTMDHAKRFKDRYDALAITTNSRDLMPEGAQQAVRDICPYLKSLKPKTIYKKIDSTWRGNIGAELEVLIKELQLDFAVICSSYPENRRFGIGGYLLVDGKLLHHTSMAKDPASPISEGFLPALLAKQTNLPIEHMPLAIVEKGHESVSVFLNEKTKQGPCLIIADAIENFHRDVIAGIEATQMSSFIFVGSAGLSAAMMRHRKQRLQKRILPILTIVGSVNPKSMTQIEKFIESNNIKEIYLHWENALNPNAEALTALFTKAVEILSDGKDLIIRTCQSFDDAESAKAEGTKRGLSGAELADTISNGLQQFVADILSETNIGGIMVTGGATALKLLEATGGEGIELHREIEPGVPMGRMVGGDLNGLKIVTKAGGFGSFDVFIRGYEILKQED